MSWALHRALRRHISGDPTLSGCWPTNGFLHDHVSRAGERSGRVTSLRTHRVRALSCLRWPRLSCLRWPCSSARTRLALSLLVAMVAGVALGHDRLLCPPPLVPSASQVCLVLCRCCECGSRFTPRARSPRVPVHLACGPQASAPPDALAAQGLQTLQLRDCAETNRAQAVV